MKLIAAFVVVVLLFLVLFQKTSAAVAQTGKKPAGKPGYCWWDETGPMNKNEKRYLKGCSLATCKDDTSIRIVSCGSLQVDGVKVTRDLSKPYPECCPKIVG